MKAGTTHGCGHGATGLRPPIRDLRRAGEASTWLLATLLLALPASPTSAGNPPRPQPAPGPAYRLISVEPFLMTYAMNDSGTLVGEWIHDFDSTAGGPYISAFRLAPRITDTGVLYLTEDVQWLRGADGTGDWGETKGVNNAGLAVGYLDYPESERATLWLADGTAVNLGVAPPGADSRAKDINDAGFVAVGHAGFNTAGVVVPEDLDGDGVSDAWFSDLNGDAVNDLLRPITLGNEYTPVAINEAGQVALAEGFFVTPDDGDSDGDGNAWFADANADGVNDRLVPLIPPGGNSRATDLNNVGQVVGNSGGHALCWSFVDGSQTVTDLGMLSSALAMFPQGINDSGQIVGTSSRKRGAGPGWLYHDKKMYELLPLMVNPEGWSNLHAWGINNRGWIFGRGDRTAGGSKAFVAIPLGQP